MNVNHGDETEVNHGDETEVDNDGEDEIYHKRPDKDKALKKYRKLKLRLDDFMEEMRKTVSLLVSNSVTTASFSGTTSTSSSSDMTAIAVTSGTTTIASPSDTTTTALTSGSTTTIGRVMLDIFIKVQKLTCSVFIYPTLILPYFYFNFYFFSADIWYYYNCIVIWYYYSCIVWHCCNRSKLEQLQALSLPAPRTSF
ncbi:uncharacterized protein LOC105846287 isoform X3 [Hydra vulgaris]|uniref:uncharacterized protein LOC105846287 isoform X3 n=1 Tax=Hydra vulgaris TaxID=6087 RepID=UPI0032E9C653